MSQSRARLLKAAYRYLTAVTDDAGTVKGWRFNPGPALREAGARSRVLQHPDGRWYSDAEAQAYRDGAVRAAAKGAAPIPQEAPASRRTLAALWDAYDAHQRRLIDTKDEEALKPVTLQGYAGMIKPWLRWGGDELVAAFTPDLIKDQYKAQRQSRGHAACHASLRALIAVLSYGVAKRWLSENPALSLGLAKPQGRLRLASPEEVNALMAVCNEGRGGLADRDHKALGDAIVAGLWTGQRLGDVLACDLGAQRAVENGKAYLIFARTHHGDFSQSKLRGREGDGGQAHVKVLEPLALRIGARTTGPLCDFGAALNRKQFNDRWLAVRAEAAKACPSVADLQYRDLRDTAVTRLALARIPLPSIALWTGHSLESIQAILRAHYLVSTRAEADRAGDEFEAWRQAAGLTW